MEAILNLPLNIDTPSWLRLRFEPVRPGCALEASGVCMVSFIGVPFVFLCFYLLVLFCFVETRFCYVTLCFSSSWRHLLV